MGSVRPSSPFDRIPRPWKERLLFLARAAAEQRTPAAVVGGCVRDLLLGRVPNDWDVVVEGDAAALVRSAERKWAVRGKEHPRFMTFSIGFSDGTHLDVATARSETYPVPGALPVVRRATMREDAHRRDFSSNALYLQLYPALGDLLDPVGGEADLNAGRLRVLHDRSFIDDPTRLYRAARYATRYAWTVETKTLDLIHRAVAANLPGGVSPVRLRHELFRFLEEENPVPALRAAWEWGLWRYWDATWTFNESRLLLLQTVPRESPPVRRLAWFLGPDSKTAAAVLKRFSTPVELRKSILGALEKAAD